MSYSAALAQLLTLSVTGVNANVGAVNVPPSSADLPVLVIDDAIRTFSEGGVKAWNVAATVTQLTIFLDHLLLIEGAAQDTFEARWANVNLYVDQYLTALAADMTMDDNLSEPLALLVVERGIISVRNSEYSGVRFRHQWKIRIT